MERHASWQSGIHSNMRITRTRTALIIIAVAAVTALLAAFTNPTGFTTLSNSRTSPPVTPVEGPSWLKHLGIAMAETHLGQMGGIGTTPDTARREPEFPQRQSADALNEPFELTGADLYRINCRSCHGPKGEGAPPEIHSLIGPVQATSAAAIQRRMETRGTAVSEQMATQMAGEAEKAIRDRLQHGGQKMPAFSYLRPEEATALIGYLRQLAGISGTQSHAAVIESAAQVGSEVINGTCHICHDATGPGGGMMTMMMQGTPPSLASLPRDHSRNSVIQQVHYGTRMMMMMPGYRMPPFPYFTDDEIAAAYLYLWAYPPK